MSGSFFCEAGTLKDRLSFGKFSSHFSGLFHSSPLALSSLWNLT
ncbi:hypothetical protein LEMLEM_LOCUS27838, partial [Lemmus lemmus]